MAERYTNPHTRVSYYQPRCLTLPLKALSIRIVFASELELYYEKKLTTIL